MRLDFRWWLCPRFFVIVLSGLPKDLSPMQRLGPLFGRLEMPMCMKMRDREREREKKNLQWRGINVHSFTGDQFTECPAHRGLVEKSHKSSGQSFCRIFASFPVIFPFRSGSGTHTYTYTPTKKKPFPPQIRSDLARKFCVWKTGSGWKVPCFFSPRSYQFWYNKCVVIATICRWCSGVWLYFN